MSKDVDAEVEAFRRQKARGARVLGVREALQLSGDEFARLLEQVAARHGHGDDVQLDKTVVSNIERGKRRLSVEEAAAVVEIDPEGRSFAWLVFGPVKSGRPVKAIDPASLTPVPRPQAEKRKRSG